jgi:hypothetical protein
MILALQVGPCPNLLELQNNTTGIIMDYCDTLCFVLSLQFHMFENFVF